MIERLGRDIGFGKLSLLLLKHVLPQANIASPRKHTGTGQAKIPSHFNGIFNMG